MAASLHLRLTVVVLAVGLWCDRCLHCTTARFGAYVMHDDGPRQLGTVDKCVECDA